MSRLEPDELTQLLTQAVAPIRPDPAAYQRIKDGIAWRRRWRLPGFALAGVVAVALVLLAAIAVKPRPSARVVEPASPVLSSLGASTPGPTSSYRGGSGGPYTDGPDDSPPQGARSASPGVPSQSTSPSPSVSRTPLDSGASPLPKPSAVPAVPGDIDGDGLADVLKLTGAELEATFTRGGEVTMAVQNALNPLQATVVDIDGDGFGEIVLQTGVEPGVKRYSVVRLVAPGELRIVDQGDVPLLVAGVDPARGVAFGFRCTPGTLTTYSATTTDLGATFTVIASTWELNGGGFVQTGSGPATSTSDRSQFTADCGDLR